MKNKHILPDEVVECLRRIKDNDFDFSTNFIDNEMIIFINEKESNKEQYTREELVNLYYKCKREEKLKTLLNEK